ncbi:MAG: prepilin-type N-terminal cleavage/methylation domain-containing protein [Candidatus Saccharibacteria bacterium]|nr:prepilin-type N-terminal cleavage/methylation domain-containing protein [Candidatus Saccharibacteria bacterium]
MKTTKQNQRGFTIIELSISMTMLSVLLLIILFSIINITSVYNRGLTLKRVNQSGRTIAASLQSDLRSSVPSNLAFRNKEKLAGNDVLTGICTGKNSYLWNVWGEGGANTNFKFYNSSELITMVKINDPGAEYCKEPYKLPEKKNVKVLLDDGLAIREPVERKLGYANKLIEFTFTISTPDDGNEIIYDASGRGSCAGGKEAEFCALNTFIVTSYAKGI